MGLGALINQSNTPQFSGAITYEPSSIGDVISSAFAATGANLNSNGARILQNHQIENQERVFKEITGTDLSAAIGEDLYNSDQRFTAADEYILKQREKDTRFSNIPTTEEMREAAKKRAQELDIDMQQTSAAASPFERVAGTVIGGIGASFADPVLMGATVATAGAAQLFRIRTALGLIAVEAGVGAASELAAQPFVAGWQKEIGNQYGLGDVATNVAFSALAGGAIAGLSSINLKNAITTGRAKSAEMFDLVASYDKTPEFAKPALRQMADIAAVREASPFTESSPAFTALHNRNVAEVDAAIAARRPITEARIDVPAEKSKIAARSVDAPPTVKKDEGDFNFEDYRNNPWKQDDAARQAVEKQMDFDFDDLAAKSPDERIIMDNDEIVTIAELDKEIKSSRALYEAIKVCSI